MKFIIKCVNEYALSNNENEKKKEVNKKGVEIWKRELEEKTKIINMLIE